MAKVKVAMDWLDICSGCEMSLLDIDERIVELLNHIELTSTPITDLKHPPKEGVDVGILTGSVGNTDQIEVAKEMRAHCKFLIAMGDCATFSPLPVTALRNFHKIEDVLERGYIGTESTINGKIPKSDMLCTLLDKSIAIDEIVKVDYYLPGCPPDADAIYFVLSELIAGRVPVLEGKNLRYD